MMEQARKYKMVRYDIDKSINEFAEMCNLSPKNYGDIERQDIPLSSKSQEKIERTIRKLGYQLLENGVIKKEQSRIDLKGDNRYFELLEDIEDRCINSGELLIDGAVESKTPVEIMDRVTKMRQRGLKMRNLVREGDRDLRWPLEEYRWLPAKDFVNQVIFIYPDSVAIDSVNENIITIHRDRYLHLSLKKKFERDWENFEQPDYSEFHND